MPVDPKITEVIKPAVRVIVEFSDGSAIEVKEGNIQREELFEVHTNAGILVLSLGVSTIGWQAKSAADYLIHPTPVRENVRDERQVVTHKPKAAGPAAAPDVEPDTAPK